MDKELKTCWVEALESGKYKKGKYGLFGPLPFSLHAQVQQGYCCLGVLADITGDLLYDGINGYVLEASDSKNFADLGAELTLKLGLCDHEDFLVGLNDKNDTFKEVVEYIKNEI